MNKKATGGILIGVALVLFFIGYMKTKPTMLEGFAEGGSKFAASVDPKVRDRMERNAAKVRNQRVQRGMPMFLIGGILGVGGIGLLASSGVKK